MPRVAKLTTEQRILNHRLSSARDYQKNGEEKCRKQREKYHFLKMEKLKTLSSVKEKVI